MATAGTLALLTDRDTVENTFTMGNVDIEVEDNFPEEGAPIRPGEEVNKDAEIINQGTNPAWVWMSVSVPEALNDYVTLMTAPPMPRKNTSTTSPTSISSTTTRESPATTAPTVSNMY